MKFEELSIETNRDMPIEWDLDIQEERKNAAMRAIFATLGEGMERGYWSEDQAIAYGATYLQYTHEYFNARAHTSKLINHKEDSDYAKKHATAAEVALHDFGIGDYFEMKSILQLCAETYSSQAEATGGSFRRMYEEYARVLTIVVGVIPDSGDYHFPPIPQSWKDPRFRDETKGEQIPEFKVIYQRGKDKV